ncbi:nuclear intron maturase 3, mitochondrial [Cucurbita pepo subsp. pepo]|uniref:nuclear intron maturase 3, mitochondrial n=1 Tax=Cucurbita pepo subsp. pepo TaxID=3664 RepID=UPI000C9D5005|nr:nuclear intron maturase 3, mitochondrial [Cucurbita pepo subsp. pepo]XP_023544823.1 nuclear intron maturase 3, mitochondrial [Cucurbita pepo subsp. pepo]XP_023544830.1 nuclear intron maturase 3, mitochondrial [Cucurbita pepo subsp. pepo]XP_023544839.1 nuclear intron maturase 3, mitochondrial [Cucurbita pepo subsp. pepo]
MLIHLRKIATPWKPNLSSSFNKLYSDRPLKHSPLLKLPFQHSVQTLTRPQLEALVLSRFSQGKFFDLLRNVVASPSVLFTASQNLITPLPSNRLNAPDSLLSFDMVSSCFSVEDMARELYENRFDVGACCVRLESSEEKGEFLVLPNLKLKVLLEAIRIVLEIVYDERFVTFSYGGRVGMGRHTAIRYLKNSVQNPSWWFTVAFRRRKFDSVHVNKLCLLVQEKIKDDILILMLKKLFELEAVQIELGGCYLGRGFPQESGLCSILSNIYFNGFDKELQQIRLEKNEENPKFSLDGTVSFHNPVKIYAVRYLDEILVITSGSKMLIMELKSQVLRYLEGNLELEVDRMNTAIHSAVSEKISFLGMELQAVPPSVLHPPMSEKAIRARKKYLRQKEVRAIELRNARERNRKKLGLKILGHVFKKLKRTDGLKYEFQIEKEVTEIFRNWADEVVRDFLESLEDNTEWHRPLSAGDFLSLKHIRNQLPVDLVNAYDRFQDQVNQHLNPLKAKKEKAREDEKKRLGEEERYAKRTVEDLTRLCIKVEAPIELVRKAVKMIGFTNKMGRPRPISSLIALEDTDIIKWYAGVGRRWLDFFCCCHNYKTVKTIVTYHLRFSCILTLAEKHESTKREAMKHYSKDLKVFDLNGKEEMHFPTEREVKMLGERNLADPYPVDGAFSLFLIRLVTDEDSYPCIAHFCNRTDSILYRVRLLQKTLNVNPSNGVEWVRGMGVIHESLNQRCLPLCADHISDLYMGKINLQDLDCTLSLDMD